MKAKFLLIAALAVAAVFTSCSKDDEDVAQTASQLTGQEIQFNVGVDNGQATRSTVITPSNYADKMWDFGVYILNSDDNSYFADNLLIYTNAGEGAFRLPVDSREYYWPTTALSFYAYSPSEGTGLTVRGTTLTYENPLTNSDQLDLMYAKATDLTFKHNITGPVDLQFKHLMSQINFKVGSVNEDYDIYIGDIRIWGFPSTIKYDLITGNLTTTGEYFTEYTVADGSGEAKTGAAIGTPLLVPPYNCDNPWSTQGHPEQDSQYITIECKIVDRENGKYVVGSDDEYGYVYMPLSGNFESGKSYNLILNFEGGNGFGYDDYGRMTSEAITYSVSVTNWQESSSNINM